MLIWLEISFAERARKVPQIPLVLLKSRRLLFLICLSVLFFTIHSFQFHSRIANVLPLLGAIVFLVLLLIIIRRTWFKLLLLDGAFAVIHAITGPVLPLPFCSLLKLALAGELLVYCLVNCSRIAGVLLLTLLVN
ncbi:hypothetical protein P4H83_02290 [Paenibacillus favisporus]|uniref:hypothetical protein n=1 Tax=Paenibacillus favisporus TaxID=221028 RepID=UPI002DB6C6D0|nr:hypothetical protein [Paenibacillus favisporus]MEC0173694.1 hypothetical protein [Paenibacillus favisporus]